MKLEFSCGQMRLNHTCRNREDGFIFPTAGDQGLALSTESHSPFCYNKNSQLCGGGDRENNKLGIILDSCSQEHPPVFCVDENEDRTVLILL